MPPKTVKAKATKRKPIKNARPISESAYDAANYARCLIQPFNSPPCHIPDPDVQPSGPISSHYTLTTPFAAFAGTSTSHSIGFVLFPYAQNSLSVLAETSAGNSTLSDVNVAGTTRANIVSAPNFTSFGLVGFRHRLAGAGIRVIYEGTELNRSGRIFGGNLPIAFAASGVGSTGTLLSALSPLVNSPTATTSGLRQAMSDVFEIRNPSEKVTEFYWKPSSVPHYQPYGNNSVSTTTAGALVANSVFAAASGLQGAELGQNALVVVIDGDTTPSASVISNTYTVEVVWHWEVVPDNLQAVAFDVSPSHAHAAALDLAFNTMAQAPVGRALAGAAANYRSGTLGGVMTGSRSNQGFPQGRSRRQ